MSGQIAPISAVVLAGGRGRRLGRDKATVELGSQTLLQRVIESVSQLSDDIIAVLRPGQHLQVDGARLATDAEPFAGLLAGMAAGITSARYYWCLVVASDMPFLNTDLIWHMMSLRPGYDVVVPRVEAGVEPLHALYHKRCLPALWRALRAGERRVVSFYRPLKVRYLESVEIARFDPTGRSFFNINAPEDLAQAQEWVRQACADQEQREPRRCSR